MKPNLSPPWGEVVHRVSRSVSTSQCPVDYFNMKPAEELVQAMSDQQQLERGFAETTAHYRAAINHLVEAERALHKIGLIVSEDEAQDCVNNLRRLVKCDRVVLLKNEAGVLADMDEARVSMEAHIKDIEGLNASVNVQETTTYPKPINYVLADEGILIDDSEGLPF